MDRRIRLRLLGRLGGALAILAPVTVALWIVFTFGVALVPLVVLEYFGVGTIVMDLYRLAPSIDYPTVSGATGVSAVITASCGYLTCVGLVVVGRKWAAGLAERRIPVFGAFVLGSVITVAETTALLSTTNPLVLYLVLAGFPIGGYCVIKFWRRGIRTAVESLREDVLAESDPAAGEYPAVDAAVTRLATQAGIPAPAVRVLETDRAESYALGPADDPLLVGTTGLFERLDEREVRAVLAHEISHLVNRDLRLLEIVLTPVYYADALVPRPDDEDRFDAAFTTVGRTVIGPIRFLARAGFAFFSVGRERAADVGAVSLCGDPASLAGALRSLDEAHGTPDTDLRTWERRVATLGVLPPAERHSIVDPFDSHPPTERRIRWLRRLTTDGER